MYIIIMYLGISCSLILYCGCSYPVIMTENSTESNGHLILSVYYIATYTSANCYIFSL